jgi:Galactose oxidase, central domain
MVAARRTLVRTPVLLVICFACLLSVGCCTGKQNSWTNLKPSGSPPPPRFGEALVQIAESGTMIMFGGASDQSNPLNDTWEYDRANNNWTRLMPLEVLPPARWGMAAAYDPGANKIVIFGGMDVDGKMLGDTWAYDVAKNEWSRLAPSSPPSARYRAKMVYDSSTHRFILFGGTYLRTSSNASFQHDFSDTWAFDLAMHQWTDLSPSGSPSTSSAAGQAMLRDEAFSRTLLFVGAEPIPNVGVPREFLQKDWLIYGYDTGGNAWTENPRSPTSPPISGKYALALDSSLHTAVLFGGVDTEGSTRSETWIFDLKANNWSRELAGESGNPPGCIDSAMVYNPETKSMILFGGRSGEGAGADIPNNTWEYRP